MPQINISIDVQNSIYLKDPLETNLGKRIIAHSIELLDEIGFEAFNFKKLANRMHSTEASVYRYFENKYKLLVYLVAWYWDFMHFMVLMDTRNVKDPKERILIVIRTLVYSLDNSAAPSFINQSKLHSIVIENAAKVYHNKKVDVLKKQGYYNNYRKIVKFIAAIIQEIDIDFKYPQGLATNLIEMSLNNEYYMIHLPFLTDFDENIKCNPREETYKMIKDYIRRLFNF